MQTIYNMSQKVCKKAVSAFIHIFKKILQKIERTEHIQTCHTKSRPSKKTYFFNCSEGHDALHILIWHIHFIFFSLFRLTPCLFLTFIFGI